MERIFIGIDILEKNNLIAITSFQLPEVLIEDEGLINYVNFIIKRRVNELPTETVTKAALKIKMLKLKVTKRVLQKALLTKHTGIVNIKLRVK